jgi:chromosome segregation ATPase
MSLELLKKQMTEMDQKINKLTSDIEKKEVVIKSLESDYAILTERLLTERNLISTWKENKNYLEDVKKETESNFIQIDNAASTLLEILKSKTDKV